MLGFAIFWTLGAPLCWAMFAYALRSKKSAGVIAISVFLATFATTLLILDWILVLC